MKLTEQRFVRPLELPVSAAEAFAWHARPGAFERLCPPWERLEVVDRQGSIANGDRVTIRLKIGPVPVKWIAEHHSNEPGVQFADRQITGPFAAWNHVHRFVTDGGSRCRLEDDISYRLPGGLLGSLLGGGSIRKMLERTFTYRHRVSYQDMVAHARFVQRGTMSIAITGASGLIGSELVPFLTTGGQRAICLRRSGSSSRMPSLGESGSWHPATGEIAAASRGAIDAVVHLAGENIAGGRWNERRKQSMRDSRVAPTRKLAEFLAGMPQKPKVFVCASAIGYYGNRGDDVLTEESRHGEGFLPELCREWEAATQPAADAGIRVVNLRIGVVLTPKGGALAKMLTPFKLGVGGVVGSGKQYWSWIAIDDVIGAIHHAIFTDSLHGPMNATAPNPVTNAEFTRTMGKVLRRPTIFPMPAFAAKLALGQMAEDLLLASARVMPSRLQETGYPFRYPELEAALRHVLGR